MRPSLKRYRRNRVEKLRSTGPRLGFHQVFCCTAYLLGSECRFLGYVFSSTAKRRKPLLPDLELAACAICCSRKVCFAKRIFCCAAYTTQTPQHAPQTSVVRSERPSTEVPLITDREVAPRALQICQHPAPPIQIDSLLQRSRVHPHGYHPSVCRPAVLPARPPAPGRRKQA